MQRDNHAVPLWVGEECKDPEQPQQQFYRVRIVQGKDVLQNVAMTYHVSPFSLKWG